MVKQQNVLAQGGSLGGNILKGGVLVVQFFKVL